MLGFKTNRKHIVYIDDEQEADNFSLTDYFKTSEEFIDRSYNRPTGEQIKKMKLNLDNDDQEVEEINM